MSTVDGDDILSVASCLFMLGMQGIRLVMMKLDISMLFMYVCVLCIYDYDL
jgi:hypothetical protein